MNEFMLMEPANQSFQELFSNGVKYIVPKFQRDYAWGQEQWEDLWSDIENMDKDPFHYMGYIVLQRKGNHDFEVIDGQQRLVTASIIILSAMNKLKALIADDKEAVDNQDRLDELSRRFIGAKNLVSLKVSSKLSLNRNNNKFYQSICSNLCAPNQRGETSTNRLLKQTFEFFNHKNMGNTGSEIASFIERITSGMMVTKIVVQNNLNAYKVFETLNARGVQLSTPDLLKNYIFSTISHPDNVTDEALNELDEDWSTVVSQLGENNFTDFTRYHHNFQKKLVTKNSLFKSIRELANTPETAYAYMQSLNVYAPIYGALLSPHDAWWREQGVEYKDAALYLDALNLFHIKQPFTILMAGFEKFPAEEFMKLLQYIYVLSVRYNVICHRSPNEQESRYNHIAMKIFNQEYKRASHVKNGDEFKYLYPDDDAFQNAFEYHRMPSRQSSRKIRCLLAEIEKHLGCQANVEDTVLEHVCPYNPEQTWCAAFGEGVHDAYDRLGNMVLLKKDNLERGGFEKKKAYYLTTSHVLARKVASYKAWNLLTMNQYQLWLAQQAVATWKVS